MQLIKKVSAAVTGVTALALVAVAVPASAQGMSIADQCEKRHQTG